MGNTDTPLGNLEKLLPSLKPLFDFVQQLAKPEVRAALVEGIKDFQRRIAEEEQAFLDFVIKNGWLGLEHHVTSEQVRLFTTTESESGKDAAEKLVCASFSNETIEKIVSGWRRIPYFQSRTHFCDDVIRAYVMGMHSLVIPALLSCAEGICAEVTGANPSSTRAVQNAAQRLRFGSDVEEYFGSAMLDVLEKSYYCKVDFVLQEAGFNRHRILHGRSADYATQGNSIRAILLVQTAIDIQQNITEQGEKLALAE